LAPPLPLILESQEWLILATLAFRLRHSPFYFFHFLFIFFNFKDNFPFIEKMSRQVQIDRIFKAEDPKKQHLIEIRSKPYFVEYDMRKRLYPKERET
jgi:hypothetical protein